LTPEGYQTTIESRCWTSAATPCQTARSAEEDRMSWEDRITVDPAVRGGKPCIKGTRITVYDLLEYMAGGMKDEEIP
jgi:hypothetical protein